MHCGTDDGADAVLELGARAVLLVLTRLPRRLLLAALGQVLTTGVGRALAPIGTGSSLRVKRRAPTQMSPTSSAPVTPANPPTRATVARPLLPGVGCGRGRSAA